MAAYSQVLKLRKLRSACLYLEENKKTKLIKNSPLPCIPKSSTHPHGTRHFRVTCPFIQLENLRPSILVTFHFRLSLIKRNNNWETPPKYHTQFFLCFYFMYSIVIKHTRAHTHTRKKKSLLALQLNK